MVSSNPNWSQSVAGVLLRDGKVLLARHTYGSGKGKLIIPGGYVNMGESPQQALKREFMEETHLEVSPRDILGIRFNKTTWYVVFRVDYVSGIAQSDHDENSEVVWMDAGEALSRADVPGLTKFLIQSALSSADGLMMNPSYITDEKNAPYSLYCI